MVVATARRTLGTRVGAGAGKRQVLTGTAGPPDPHHETALAPIRCAKDDNSGGARRMTILWGR